MHLLAFFPAAVALGAAVGAAADAVPVVATTFTAPLIPLEQNAGSDDQFPMPECGGFQLEEATVDQMQAAMANGTLTSVQLVTCYMLRAYQTEDFIK